MSVLASDEGHEPEHQLHWYTDPARPHPFKLAKKITSGDPNAPAFRSVALFPWSLDSLGSLWRGAHGSPPSEEAYHHWSEVVEEYSDAVAVGTTETLYVFFMNKKRQPICFNTSKEPPLSLLPVDCMCVAWVLSEHPPFYPMIVFNRGSALYIYSIVRKGIASYLRGHGGAITSIAVHPVLPQYFCTTSRDNSTRIYNLNLSPQQVPNNPIWPPSNQPSLAGAAHGLHMTESEGIGLGRCIAVLMGGRSGGHDAAVLGAAFHPQLPVIATCGLDRFVKIWFFRPGTERNTEHIIREDKPLFSSGRIHKARVLSVTWLQDDLLLTNSAPALMRDLSRPEDKDTYLEAGELVIWRWLSVDRFFPQDMEDVDQVVHGCASDYQDSSSFKIVSVNAFPHVPNQLITPRLHVFQSFKRDLYSPIYDFQTRTHDPLVLYTYPEADTLTISNIALLPPRRPPPFPLDHQNAREDPLVTATEQINLEDVSPEQQEEVRNRNAQRLERLRDRDAQPPITGWQVNVDGDASRFRGATLENCAMGMDGGVIVGVGTKGTVWIWKLGYSEQDGR